MVNLQYTEDSLDNFQIEYKLLYMIDPFSKTEIPI